MSQALKAAILPVTPKRIFLSRRTNLRLSFTKGFIQIGYAFECQISIKMGQLLGNSFHKMANSSRSNDGQIIPSEFSLEPANHPIDHRRVPQDHSAFKRLLRVIANGMLRRSKIHGKKLSCI